MRRELMDDDDLRVKIVKRSNRKFYILRWRDPATGDWKEQTTRTRRRREAEVAKRKLIARLIEEDYASEYGWHQFVERYESEVISFLKAKTKASWNTAKRHYERIINPATVHDAVEKQAVSRFVAKMRDGDVRDSSIRSYVRQLYAAFGWAEQMDLVPYVSRYRFPRRSGGASKLARARPITREEFDRILDAVRKVRTDDWRQWDRFLRGLWESGFRLTELYDLSWDGEGFTVDNTGSIPVVRIHHDHEKAGSDRIQPITPEFWAVCCETPEANRTGRVFPMLGVRQPHRAFRPGWIGKVITEIGRRAGVVTDVSDRKCASSHDIGRRAFATRMAPLMSETDLAHWMRHVSSDTTRKYYLIARAESLAQPFWR